MVLCSSRTGQAALQTLPTSQFDANHPQQVFGSINDFDISSYPLPQNVLQADGTSSGNQSATPGRRIGGIGSPRRRASSSQQSISSVSSEGIPVWKINKNGKLQARRLAFSLDRRSILVTTTRIKTIRGFFKAATGSRENETKTLELLRVDRIQKGMHTARFRRATRTNALDTSSDRSNNSSNNGQSNPLELIQEVLQKHKTLSIIYEFEGHFESLDLAIPDPNDYQILVRALEGLIQMHNYERNCKTRELRLLQFHWIEMRKALEAETNNSNPTALASLSQSEFLQMADRLDFLDGFGKQQLTSLFKKKCEELKRKSEQLRFSEVAGLLERLRKSQNLGSLDPLEYLWSEMYSTDPVPGVTVEDDASYSSYELNVMDGNPHVEESVSTVAFLSFLRSHQREFSKTLEEATDLVNMLNCLNSSRSLTRNRRNRTAISASSQAAFDPYQSPPRRKAIAPDDRLTKSRFMDYMLSDLNDLLTPASSMDMSRPLSHYFIATSHASFLNIPVHLPGASSWNQFDFVVSDKAEVESIYTALYRGVRCLEVVAWDGPNQIEPIVGLSDDDRKSLRFRNCLYAITYFLDEHPESFPILLKIENHCSTKVQSLLAQQIREMLGLQGLLFEPSNLLQDHNFVLPSPEEARGKVIVLGKRPRETGKKRGPARVMNDDYDADNDEWKAVASPSEIKYFDDEEQMGENKGVVVGVDALGPVYCNDVHAIARTPLQVWQKAESERSAAELDAQETKRKAVELEERAQRKQAEAFDMSKKAGVSVEEFMHERRLSGRQESSLFGRIVEEKSMKDDEGVEVHEVVSDILEASQQEYAKAAHEAMESAKRVMNYKNTLDVAENRLREARKDLDQSKNRVNYLVEESQRARLKATANHEHAAVANARLERVRDLLKNSEETSTSAETVVVTALTEAKISEKRAADAEARATRAFANAAKDRARSDEETRKEEELENKVNALLGKCKDAAKIAKTTRGRLDKVAASLERVNDQINLIENSSTYQNELRNGASPSDIAARHGSSFVDKHAAKIAERDMLTRSMRDMNEELQAAEEEKARLQTKFEELNQMLRLQTELASKMRKVADRSAHVAEELAEHAEEEREAANLRHVARERAEANVHNRGTHKESLQTQYQEAKRAAAEASALAEESRKRADQLEKDLEGAQDFNRLLQIVEEREWAMNEAKAQYDAALQQRQQKDALLIKQKKMFEVSAEVRNNAKREIEQEEDRVRAIKYYHQEAICAYDQAARLRQEAEFAANLAALAAQTAAEKAKIAQRALEYKDKMSLVVEIPPNLAAQTLLHSLRFFHWQKSFDLCNAHYHSIAFHVLHKIVTNSPDLNTRNLRKFTETHMCRIFPSPKDIKKNKTANYDPVFPWSLGCQLVSMNYSSPDEHLLVSEGMFRKYGSCGYVLKPPRLFGPGRKEGLQRWSVKILGAYHLPKHYSTGNRRQSGLSMRPIVRLTLFSGEAGALPFTFESRESHKQGTDPVLFTEDNICTFDVGNQWIAMASFTVWDKSIGDGKLQYIAGAAIPVSCFREGYRSISLFDAHHSRTGPYKFASILVYVSRSH
ncbi:hypothetical protein ACA910_012978 [Epithemia clementina (nom. ined.)]